MVPVTVASPGGNAGETDSTKPELQGESSSDSGSSTEPDDHASEAGSQAAPECQGQLPSTTSADANNPFNMGPQSVQTRIDDHVAAADDNLTFGEAMASPKASDSLQIYFQNANLIRSDRMEKWLDACVTMQAKEVDLFGFAEINVNPRHPGLTEEVNQIAKRNWTHASTTLTNTSTDCRTWAQQGVTSLTTTRKWISRLVENGHDEKLGRWSYHILRGSNNQRTVFVSGYQVCQSTVAGPLTAASQQWSLLKQAGVINPNPRKQFFLDLATQIKNGLGRTGRSVSCWTPTRVTTIQSKALPLFSIKQH